MMRLSEKMLHGRYNLQSPLEIKGMWWKPAKPDLKLSGILNYSENRTIKLNLWGEPKIIEEFLGYNWTIGPGILPKQDIILGITDTGTLVTIIDSFESRSLLSIDYSVNYVILHRHFNDRESIKFESLLVRYSHLEKWSGKIFLEAKKSFFAEQNNSYSHKVTTLKVPSIQSQISIVPFQYRGDIKKDFNNLIYYWYLEFQPAKTQKLEWYLQLTYQLRDLLCMLLGYPVFPLEFLGVHEGQTFSLLFHDRRIELASSYSNIESEHLLLNYDQLEVNIEEVFDNYFKIVKEPENRDIFSLFAETFYGISHLDKMEFLALVQVLEGFSARVEKNEIEGKRKLLQRLMYLYSKIDDYRHFIAKKPETFFDTVVNTRDIFSHYYPSDKRRTFTDDELDSVNNRLKIFNTLIWGKKFGIDTEVIYQSINHHRRYPLLLDWPLNQALDM